MLATYINTSNPRGAICGKTEEGLCTLSVGGAGRGGVGGRRKRSKAIANSHENSFSNPQLVLGMILNILGVNNTFNPRALL